MNNNAPYQLGKYQHFRNGQTYEIIGFAIHSETREEMVIYQALYHSEEFGLNQTWVRPKAMFFETVNFEGKMVPRFKFLEKNIQYGI